MYITTAELGLPYEALIKLTDDEGAGQINDSRLESAICSAQAIVDAALSRLCPTPLISDPGDLVRALTRQVAIYNLYLRLGSVPAPVAKSYEDACKTLDAIASGGSVIGGREIRPEFTSEGREFSRGYMEGM